MTGARAATAEPTTDDDDEDTTTYAAFGPHKVLEDIKQYATSPARWDRTDWLLFGGSLALVGAVHPFDARVRTHFTAGSKTALDGKDKYSVQDALPAAAVVGITALYATITDDDAGRSETWAMLEAGGLASVTGFALKTVAGRERPNAPTDPNAWRQHGGSFPSLHASAAFAIGTVLAESGNDDYRWVRRVIGYGVASATAFERLKHNAHWLSDVVAGGALGAATGVFVVNRETTSHESGFNVEPNERGLMLSYTVPIH